MSTLIQIIFIVVSALILGSALLVVTVRNIIHAALWLIASFFGVGALYLLMEAEFAAVVQVLIYVGAVSILILFAIMLTRHIGAESTRQLYRRWWLALGVSALLFGLLIVPTVARFPWQPIAPVQANTGIVTAVEIGQAFMGPYLLPFEVASVVLLVALVGAVVIAFEDRAARRQVLTLAEQVALRHAGPRGDTNAGEDEPAQPEAAKDDEEPVATARE